MQDEVGRRETVEEGRSRGNYDADDLEEDVSSIFFTHKKKNQKRFDFLLIDGANCLEILNVVKSL